MKARKQLSTFSKIFLCSFFMLSLYSCSLFTSQIDEIEDNRTEENHDSSAEGNDSLTSGSSTTTQKNTFTLVVTPEFNETSQTKSRSAYPTFNDTQLSGLDYWISSSEFQDTKGTYESGKITFKIYSLTFTTPTEITVYAKQGENILFTASTTISYTTLGETKELSLNFSPASSGKGYINLKISFPSGYSIICSVLDEEGNQISDVSIPGTSIPIGISIGTTICQIYTDENIGITPGTYKARIQVYKDSVLRSFIQQNIEVWPGLTTNLWYLPDGQTNQTYSISEETKKTFYVRGQGGTLYSDPESLGITLTGLQGPSTSNDGTILSPFSMLQKALTKCTDSTVDYTIYVDGKVTDGPIIGGSDPDIGANIQAHSITVKGITGPDKDIIDRNLTSSTANGSVIRIEKTISITFCGLKFTGGYTSGNGGGILISDSDATVKIKDCVISENHAQYGGGIYNSGSCYIYGSTVIGNTSAARPEGGNEGSNSANLHGGGIYNTSKVYLGYSDYTSELVNTKSNLSGGIYACSTDGNGGGIYNDNGTVLIASGTLTNNYASALVGSSEGGGGLFSTGSSALVTMSGSSSIYKCKSNDGNGGGARIVGGTFNLTESASITYNECRGGAGIYITSSTVNLKDNSVVDHNSTSGWGGGIFIQNGVSKLTISDNASITNNTGSEGGGINAVTANDDDVLTIEMSGGLISGNTGSSEGGGVRCHGGNFTMSGGIIDANTSANGNGGGVCIKSSSIFTISGSAYIPGGVSKTNDVYLGNGKPITITGALTPPASCTNGIIAVIKPAAYTADDLILGLAASTDPVTYLKKECNKFELIQESGNTGALWEISSIKGSLQRNITLLEKDEITDGSFDGSYDLSEVFKQNRKVGSIRGTGIIVSDHETTQAEYEKYCNYGGDKPSDQYGKGDYYPAYYVSWYDAIIYCNLRSMDEDLEPVYVVDGKTNPEDWGALGDADQGFYAPNPCTWDVTILADKNGWRLPTEIEWEYFARGGNLTNTSPTYSGSNTASEVSWYGPTSSTSDPGTSGDSTHPVKKLQPNAFGLYDMSGNVWEWTNDWHSNATGWPWIPVDTPSSGAFVEKSNNCRVTKGGGFSGGVDQSPVGNRGRSSPDSDRFVDLGFRVVRGAQYMGSNLPSVAKKVGDIVFNDGSSTAYTDGIILSDTQKNAAIALIFYKGIALDSGDDETIRTLGLGLKHASNNIAWCSNDSNAKNLAIEIINCGVNGNYRPYTFTGDLNGSDNLEQIANFLSGESTDDTETEEKYPAFYFAKKYKETATNLGIIYADGWYLPSVAELYQIWLSCIDSTSDSHKVFDIDTASSLLGGDVFKTLQTWSATPSGTGSAFGYDFNLGYWGSCDKTSPYNYSACAIREF